MCRPLALKFPALSKRQSKKRNMQNRTTSWFSYSFIWCIWYRATDSAGTRRQDFIRFDFYGIIISQTGICRKPCFACKFTAKRLFCQTFFCFFAAFTEKTRQIQEFSQKIQQGNLNVHAGATLFRGQRIQPYCSTSASSYRKRLIDFLGVFSNSSL